MPEWTWWIAAAGLAIAGVALAVIALFADRSRGRPRCLRCGYDMRDQYLRDAPSLRCPECGREHGDVVELLKTRRHWPVAVFGGVLIVAGAALATGRHIHTGPGGWWSLAPMWLLLDELERSRRQSVLDVIWERTTGRRNLLAPPRADAMSDRNWQRLTDLCMDIANNPNATRMDVWWSAATISFAVPRTLADPRVAALLRHPSCTVREATVGMTHSSFMERGSFSPEWIDDLVWAAGDPSCPGGAYRAMQVIAQVEPFHDHQLRALVESISSPASPQWQGLIDGFTKRRLSTEREAFVVWLETCGVPGAAQAAAAIRKAYE